jgi:hypothetical protein
LQTKDAEQVPVGVVGNYGRVRPRRVAYVDARFARPAGDVGEDSRPGRGEGGDPVFPVFEGTVVHEGGVPGAEGDDPESFEVTDGEKELEGGERSYPGSRRNGHALAG